MKCSMELQPFRAVRYNDPRPDAGDGVLDLEGVIVPYVAAADPTGYVSFLDDAVNEFSVLHLLSADGVLAWHKWLENEILLEDESESMYLYRIGFRDSENRLQQVSMVVGALSGVADPLDRGPADVVPLVATIEADGFSDLLVPTDMPVARATDPTGAHHRLWMISQAGVIEAISDAVRDAEIQGNLDVERGSATRMACVTERLTPDSLPALGMTLRRR